ncbi:NAD(P)-dependent oxidoreductase [Leeia sp. TBRC 13508]|uniref:NAD(P)-dependent oxidoreductase n=1 Tax=Leeia speluncae TaxID=2884804 RepID=A0ABS8D5Z0_9NEIS|nr:NAD(P)-dependent oxidoreductase [Leeia speluncae]MCB6183591.1 NAD(P)-dependent oxidoreductase [Leeia speluncae]
MLKAGYAGLGIMGRPMALNLTKAGFSLAVYSRRKASAEELITAGAEFAETPAALAALVDVLFINVSDTPDVEDVLFGSEGVVHGAKKGLVVVDMGTTSPSATREFAARLLESGVDLLDAPVSGGEVGAINGTLTIMAGGGQVAFDRAKPMFEAMGKTITHVGAVGAGQVAKACNQIVVGGTIVAVAEALLFAEKQGVDGAKVREALLGGFAQSKILEVHGQRILDDNFKPGFKTKLHQKDMRIVLEEALNKQVALPGAAQVLQYLNALMGMGEGELDSSAIFHVLSKMSKS